MFELWTITHGPYLMDRYDRGHNIVIIYPFEENNLSMIPASYPVDDLKILKILLAISCTKNKSLLQYSQKPPVQL